MNESLLRAELERALARQPGPADKGGAMMREEIQELMGWGKVKAHDAIRKLVLSGAWECVHFPAPLVTGGYRNQPHYRPKVGS